MSYFDIPVDPPPGTEAPANPAPLIIPPRKILTGLPGRPKVLPPLPKTQGVFQVVSDIHLEQWQEAPTKDIIQPSVSDYLILPGDVAAVERNPQEYSAWLFRISPLYKRIFLVPGNREYYAENNNITTTDRILRDIGREARFNNKLIILQKGRYDMEDEMPKVEDKHQITILGCTLWSAIRHDADGTVEQGMDPDNEDEGPAPFQGHDIGDGPKIPGNNDTAHRARFADHYAWLKAEVSKVRVEKPEHKILIVTHHAPCLRGVNERKFDGPDGAHLIPPDRAVRWSAFQSDILGGEGIDGLREDDAWVFGHTHFSCDFKQDEVRVYSNQRGGRTSDTIAGRRKTRYVAGEIFRF